jgi:GNAT superfamily N-acetyltransferase
LAADRKTLAQHTPEEIVRLCEINFIDYWRAASDSANAEFHEERGATYAFTGIRQEIFNVVLRTEFDETNAEANLDYVMDYFKQRRVPLLWYTGLLCTPNDMRSRLEKKGFPHDYDLTAMAIDLDAVKKDFAKPDGLIVKKVDNSSDSRKWIECLASSWESPKELVPWMMANPCYNVELKAKSGKPLPRRLFLGTIDDEPVGTTMLNWTDNLIGLQTVGTSKASRYKGVGSAVVSAALDDARAMGFKFVVVLSTVEGVKLYGRLGFKVFGKLPEHSMHFEK